MRKAPNLKIRRHPDQVENPDRRSTSPGECTVILENEIKTQATTAVIQGKRDSLPLLGGQTLEDSGMVQFYATGGLKNPNCNEIKAISKVDTRNEQLYRILHQYQGQFVGIRKAQRDGRDIAIHLPLKHETTRLHKDPIT